MILRADLHIDSCLSPCADITMVPGVVRKRLANLECIAISDHNSCGNVLAFNRAIDERTLIPALEVTSSEEVHVLAYFGTFRDAAIFNSKINEYLPKLPYNPELMGYQMYVNSQDRFTGIENRFLGSALLLNLPQLIELIIKYKGIPAYAHIERRFGVLFQLGLFPRDERVKIVEARTIDGWKKATEYGYVVLSNSDSHHPDEIGCRFTRFRVQHANQRAIYETLKEACRRKIRSVWD